YRYRRWLAVSLRGGRRFGKTNGDLAGQPTQVLFELAQARFARVAADDLPDSLVRDDELVGAQPGLRELPRDEGTASDLDFLFFAVAGQAQHFHPIQERPWHRVERIGGRDEKDARQIERQVEVIVAKGEILGRVEDLHEGRCRVAAEIAA